MNQERIELALFMLNAHIAQGVEYPDAEWQVARRLNMNTSEIEKLQAAYDAQENQT